MLLHAMVISDIAIAIAITAHFNELLGVRLLLPTWPGYKQGLMAPTCEPLGQPCQEDDANDDRISNVVIPHPVRLNLMQANVDIGNGQTN